MPPRTRRPRWPEPDEVPRVDWADLGPAFIKAWGRPNGRHEPEHLTVYGKSGGGKSYFVAYVLQMRAAARGSHIVVIATKKADRTLTAMRWPIIDEWPPDYGHNQVIYWAKARGISAEGMAPQQKKVRDLLNKLWVKDSNIIVYVDELPYVETDLKLKREIAVFYREGRANGITMVASMQRPSGVNRFAHSESGWTVAFPPKDADDRDRVAEVLGNRVRFREVLDGLDRTKHEFLIRHDLTGESYISHLPARRMTKRPEVSPQSARGVPSVKR